MNRLLLSLACLLAACSHPPDPEVAAWRAQAQRVTIVRDDWGIAHVRGKTDADAVFGMVYAQAEDDFNRIEVNFLNAQGRLAEAEGEAEIWRDLRMKLFIEPKEMQALYAGSPPWLKELMDAWADGLNYYLQTHPEVKPRVLNRFEPWMALTFSEGSIGGDIERISLGELEAFYGDPGHQSPDPAGSPNEPGALAEPAGSNGFAIAPSHTATGNALLLINPHTSFYFRSELQMTSDEGLNAYGAVTWGQFFVYQGFNETAGWMHTSSGVDNIDEYRETVVERDGALYYLYGSEERPLLTRRIAIPYRSGERMAEREFTVYETHRGPIVRAGDAGRWVSVRLMEEPLKALQQSFLRTKAGGLDEFIETMRLHTNSSNNTVFADARGNIAYLHANFIPIRDPRFDFSAPMDGRDPATDWQGVHTFEAAPNSINPANGWVQNTNNWPWSVAGALSPRQADYPGYVDRSGENARGIHALRLLEGRTGFTLQGLIDAAYDTYLPAFDVLLPALLRAWDGAPAGQPFRDHLGPQIEALRTWDRRWNVDSVPTALAIFWGNEVLRRMGLDTRSAWMAALEDVAGETPPEVLLESLAAASARLTADFGTWRTPWGEINRFQRLTGDIVQPFDDAQPSIPVGFTPSIWGSLAAFGQRTFNGTRKIYGTRGNSFVAVVEFGERVRARAITAGGLSSDPASPHFDDQAKRYASGDLRPVYFYPDELQSHAERSYHPGE